VSIGESSDDHLLPASPAMYLPTEAWLNAFEAQCSEAMLKRLRRYATLLTKLPGGEHLGDPASYAEELVQASVADLAAGVLRWDPGTKELEPYLTDVLRLRARRDRKRATRYAHLSIDTVPTSSALVHEVETCLADAAAHDDDEAMTRSLRELRGLTSADPLAQRFLDALDRGAGGRTEIMSLAGLTRADYHNTRRRLARLLTQLPPAQRMSTEEN
jgi:DNA-directed RNA polymerase specialized sigma24 family protein